jgi:hypothetical protein
MTEDRGEVYDSADEYNRDERIETIYQGWGAREMAERIVDLEDELGADVDGICTGMHADVAEAHAEVERLRSVLLELDHRLSWHTTCKTCARILDSAYEETVRAEIAEKACDRYRLAWTSARSRVKRARWAGVSDLRFTRNMWADAVRDLTRYRLAWLSARRRAADEANYGMEALDLKAAEVARLTADRDWWQRGHETAESQLVYERRENARLRAELDDLRKSTHGA